MQTKSQCAELFHCLMRTKKEECLKQCKRLKTALTEYRSINTKKKKKKITVTG